MSVSDGGSGVLVRRRLVVVGSEVASCHSVGDGCRPVDGETIRRRVGMPGAEVDVGAETRRRPGTGAADAAEVGGCWKEGAPAGDAEDAGTVCPVGRAVLRRAGASGAPGERWLPETGVDVYCWTVTEGDAGTVRSSGTGSGGGRGACV